MKGILKLSEDFYSIQGEGRSTGIPAYFIRLTDCNLSCGATQKLLNKIRMGTLDVDANAQWHGDLHKEGKASWTCDSIPVWIKGEEKSFDYIFTKWKLEGIYDSIFDGTTHIIWTGGEPTLKYHQEAIVDFLNTFNNIAAYGTRFVEFNPYNEIETNGTNYINDELFAYLDQINCSAKLSNSGMHESKRIVPKAIRRIMEHKNYQFKFVVSTEEDIKEVFKDYVNQFDIPLRNVACMPGLDDQENYHERTNFICEMAKKYKFTANQRLHISSWGAVTGV